MLFTTALLKMYFKNVGLTDQFEELNHILSLDFTVDRLCSKVLLMFNLGILTKKKKLEHFSHRIFNTDLSVQKSNPRRLSEN